VDEMTEKTIEGLREARRQRRESLLSRAGSVELFVLLDESVLMRPVGGTKVFTDQLRELHRLATDGVMKIRMVPFTLDVPITSNASFDLLSLDVNDVEGMLLYHENGLTDEVIEVESTTRRHRARYDKVWQKAVSELDTIDFLQARIRTLEAADTGRRRAPARASSRARAGAPSGDLVCRRARRRASDRCQGTERHRPNCIQRRTIISTFVRVQLQ